MLLKGCSACSESLEQREGMAKGLRTEAGTFSRQSHVVPGGDSSWLQCCKLSPQVPKEPVGCGGQRKAMKLKEWWAKNVRADGVEGTPANSGVPYGKQGPTCLRDHCCLPGCTPGERSWEQSQQAQVLWHRSSKKFLSFCAECLLLVSFYIRNSM